MVFIPAAIRVVGRAPQEAFRAFPPRMT